MKSDLQTVLERVKAIRWSANVIKIDGDMQDLLTLADSHADLLQALQECLQCEFAVTDKAAIAKANIAIAKATGEPS
jgi:hypothetical protein